MAVTHYGHVNAGQAVFIKTAAFFLEQKRQSRPGETWHSAWEPIEDCETIGQARRKYAKAKGVELSHIHDGER